MFVALFVVKKVVIYNNYLFFYLGRGKYEEVLFANLIGKIISFRLLFNVYYGIIMSVNKRFNDGRSYI